MVRYPKVPTQDVVLYYVLMEFGSHRRAYLYQVANVLAAVLVFAVPVLITKIQYQVVFFAKIVHTNYTRVHWYKGTGVLVPVYWLREQPYVRIRTKLYLPTSWCAMARTAGTSRLLTFVPVPCIPVVLRTVSHWFACVHVIRGLCHYRRTW